MTAPCPDSIIGYQNPWHLLSRCCLIVSRWTWLGLWNQNVPNPMVKCWPFPVHEFPCQTWALCQSGRRWRTITTLEPAQTRKSTHLSVNDGYQANKGSWLVSGRNFSLFKFWPLTSQDSHAHSLSHGNLITPLTPTVLLPPYNLRIKTNTDKNKEHPQLDYSIPELSKDNNNNN